MKKKTVAGICLVSIVMLMIPITAANTTLESQTTHQSVNLPFYMTKEKLPLLQKAVPYIDDPEVQQLMQAVIETLKTKNVVTRADIHGLMDMLNIRNMDVYTGPIISGGQGEAHSIPGYILEETFGGYLGPVLIGSFISDGSTRVGFPLTSVTGFHKGYVIGFIGAMTLNMWEHGLLYGMVGISPLIIISPQDY